MGKKREIRPLLARWKQDELFKTIASATASFGVTVLFALYHGFLGIWLPSVWYGAICVVYLLLAAIRGMILWTEKKIRTRENGQRAACRRRTFVISAALLMVLNLSLALPISWMVRMKKPVNMGLIPAIAMAAYTTYKITMASVHFRRRKKFQNVLMAELRTIGFIDALISILTLQNTLIMVNQEKADAHNMLIVSAISGAVIYVVINGITVHMLAKELRKK